MEPDGCNYFLGISEPFPRMVQNLGSVILLEKVSKWGSMSGKIVCTGQTASSVIGSISVIASLRLGPPELTWRWRKCRVSVDQAVFTEHARNFGLKYLKSKKL